MLAYNQFCFVTIGKWVRKRGVGEEVDGERRGENTTEQRGDKTGEEGRGGKR